MKKSLEEEVRDELDRLQKEIQEAILNRFKGKLKFRRKHRVIRKMKSTIHKVLMKNHHEGRL